MDDRTCAVKRMMFDPNDPDSIEALGNALCVRAANLRKPVPLKEKFE